MFHEVGVRSDLQENYYHHYMNPNTLIQVEILFSRGTRVQDQYTPADYYKALILI